jgi:hypothetical protein
VESVRNDADGPGRVAEDQLRGGDRQIQKKNANEDARDEARAVSQNACSAVSAG